MPAIDALLQALKQHSSNIKPVGIVAKATAPVDPSALASDVADSMDDSADDPSEGDGDTSDESTSPEQDAAIVSKLQDEYPDIYKKLKAETAGGDDMDDMLNAAPSEDM